MFLFFFSTFDFVSCFFIYKLECLYTLLSLSFLFSPLCSLCCICSSGGKREELVPLCVLTFKLLGESWTSGG